ncbi:MAG TPA: hypothetical protein VF771_10540 [Longimicrobiaceae bacterium]
MEHPAVPRAWVCHAGLLARRGPPAEPIPDWAPLHRASGDPLPEPPSDFWLIGGDGRVTRRFESRAWSVEDELGAEVYLVIGDELREIGMTARFRSPEEIREAVVLRGLREVGDGDEDAWRRISAAVEREMAARADAAERARREGEARVAAIPGALEDYAAGDDFRAAQELLRVRLAACPAPEYEPLLRVLMELGALHRASDGELRRALEWVMEPYVAACRIAAYDREAQALRGREWPATGAIAVTPSPELRRLAATLSDAHASVLKSARWATDTDARNTAIHLREVAAIVDASRARLARILGG